MLRYQNLSFGRADPMGTRSHPKPNPPPLAWSLCVRRWGTETENFMLLRSCFFTPSGYIQKLLEFCVNSFVFSCVPYFGYKTLKMILLLQYLHHHGCPLNLSWRIILFVLFWAKLCCFSRKRYLFFCVLLLHHHIESGRLYVHFYK